MTATIARPLWIDRFVSHMSKLGVRASADHITLMAEELWTTEGARDPVEVAQAEWDVGPPHDD